MLTLVQQFEQLQTVLGGKTKLFRLPPGEHSVCVCVCVEKTSVVVLNVIFNLGEKIFDFV